MNKSRMPRPAESIPSVRQLHRAIGLGKLSVHQKTHVLYRFQRQQRLFQRRNRLRQRRRVRLTVQQGRGQAHIARSFLQPCFPHLKAIRQHRQQLLGLRAANIRVRYMHSDVATIERMEIIRDLRLGEFDVLVGINLLREGLDLPEVSLVAVLDADKEGFLRSETSLIQTIGRAARNAEGLVILYADTITPSMRAAMDETERRRKIQDAYNKAHGIVPKTIIKDVREILEISKSEDSSRKAKGKPKKLTDAERAAEIAKLEQEMKEASKLLEFEYAAVLRDRIIELKGGK